MPAPAYTFATFDSLSTYRTYLELIETELGELWQSPDGYSDGTSYILTIPEGLESLVPSSYERVSRGALNDGFWMR